MQRWAAAAAAPAGATQGGRPDRQTCKCAQPQGALASTRELAIGTLPVREGGGRARGGHLSTGAPQYACKVVQNVQGSQAPACALPAWRSAAAAACRPVSLQVASGMQRLSITISWHCANLHMHQQQSLRSTAQESCLELCYRLLAKHGGLLREWAEERLEAAEAGRHMPRNGAAGVRAR